MALLSPDPAVLARPPRGGVAYADLLHALAQAEGSAPAAARLALHLGFRTRDEHPAPAVAPEAATGPEPGAGPPLQPAPAAADEPLRAGHVAITRCERVAEDDEPEPPPPEPAVPPLTLQDCQPRRREGAPPFVPLVRPAALWPALRASLAHTRPGRPDIARLAALVARGRLPARLPRRRHTAWPAALQVLWDRADALGCYQQDYQDLVQRLQALRGRAGLQVQAVSGVPTQVLPASGGQPGRLPPPAPGGQVLVLSDLGALAPGPEAAVHWQRFLHQQAAAGSRVVAWVPHSRRLVRGAAAALARVHCLHPASGLGAQKGRAPSAGDGLAAARDALLLMMACCLRVEPELLRALRLAHPATAHEPGVEAVVWGHQPVVRASCVSRPLAADVQGAYRQRFATLPVAQQRAAFVHAWRLHAWQGRSTQEAEVLLWQTHASAAARQGFEPAAAADARQWFQRLRRTLDGDPGTLGHGLGGFAADFVQRNAGDPAFLGQRDAPLVQLWAHSGLQSLPQGLDPAAALQARHRLQAQRDGEPPELQLWQHGSQLVLRPVDDPPSSPACSRLGMPLRAFAVACFAPGQPGRSVGAGGVLPWPQAEPMTLQAGGMQLTLETLQRPAWARECGRDRHGLYADLPVGSEVQRMRWIEPGEFIMGSPADEPERDGDEGPQHRVRISRGFWLADSACTQALWQAASRGPNPSRFTQQQGGGPQHPVEQVSWDEVQAWLGGLQPHLQGWADAALPTEAEWEYACRAGTRGPFWLGPDIRPAEVNYNGDHPYAGAPKGENRERTVPVKGLPANPWGLYEVHGNVFEWCADDLRDYSDAAVADPGLHARGMLPRRALRGGSWGGNARYARSAYRSAGEPAVRFDFIGFRFALRSTSPGRQGALEGRGAAPGDLAPAPAGTAGAGRPEDAPVMVPKKKRRRGPLR